MNLHQQVRVNMQIMNLIKSKYDQYFPSIYSTQEARYYRTLERDTNQAIQALKHGGLAVPPEEP
jgi:hypothetical protein